jgi:hypothetical protein
MVKHQFVSGIFVMMIALHGCGGGARPYGAMFKAAESDLSCCRNQITKPCVQNSGEPHGTIVSLLSFAIYSFGDNR